MDPNVKEEYCVDTNDAFLMKCWHRNFSASSVSFEISVFSCAGAETVTLSFAGRTSVLTSFKRAHLAHLESSCPTNSVLVLSSLSLSPSSSGVMTLVALSSACCGKGAALGGDDVIQMLQSSCSTCSVLVSLSGTTTVVDLSCSSLSVSEGALISLLPVFSSGVFFVIKSKRELFLQGEDVIRMLPSSCSICSVSVSLRVSFLPLSGGTMTLVAFFCSSLSVSKGALISLLPASSDDVFFVVSTVESSNNSR
uniref:Uncharacterized protein n=1 Tax=Ditylum brightwellii TaxID=49249 RepID=A0A7S4RA96_9STRA